MNRPLTALLACGALAALGCPPEPGQPQAAQPSQPAPSSEPAASPSADGAPVSAAPQPSLAPFDRATARTPWKDAQVGDWAIYEMHKPKQRKMRFEIVAVGEATVSWVRTNEAGEHEGSPIEEDLAERDSRYQEVEELDSIESQEAIELEVEGKKLNAIILKRASSTGAKTENWITKEIPPFMEAGGGQAMVRSVKDGELVYELLDFGKAE